MPLVEISARSWYDVRLLEYSVRLLEFGGHYSESHCWAFRINRAFGCKRFKYTRMYCTRLHIEYYVCLLLYWSPILIQSLTMTVSIGGCDLKKQDHRCKSSLPPKGLSLATQCAPQSWIGDMKSMGFLTNYMIIHLSVIVTQSLDYQTLRQICSP